MEILRAIVIDLSANTVVSFLSKLQQERNLSNDEMEIVVTKVLNEVRSVKEVDYANKILELTYKIQQLEKSEKEEVKDE